MTLTNVLPTLGLISKHQIHRIIMGLTIALGITMVIPTAHAAEEQQQTRQGLPGRRISGASRLPTFTCARDDTRLVAIVPESNLGATATATPTLWLNIPAIAETKQLEFYLFNTQNDIVYQNTFTIQPAASLLGLDLSTMAGAPELEVNQHYRWAASIVCNPKNYSENIAVEGWINRVPEVSFEESDLWYDRLSVLLAQLQNSPQNRDILRRWRTLMVSARLDQFVPLSLDANGVEITPGSTTQMTN